MMQTPRQLLVALALGLAVIAGETWHYPPDYLTFSKVWSATAFLAALTCLAAAIRPRRIFVAISGATVVTSSAARGLALVIELVEKGHTDAQPPFIVGATGWAMIALLAFVVWREYVLPWSVTTEHLKSKADA